MGSLQVELQQSKLICQETEVLLTEKAKEASSLTEEKENSWQRWKSSRKN